MGSAKSPWESGWEWTGFNLENFGDYLASSMDNWGDVLGLSKADKNKLESTLSGVPLVGDLIKAGSQWDYMQDYMKNKNLDWSDVKYPALLNSGLGSGAVSTINLFNRGTNFVSKNIDSFYD